MILDGPVALYTLTIAKVNLQNNFLQYLFQFQVLRFEIRQKGSIIFCCRCDVREGQLGDPAELPVFPR